MKNRFSQYETGINFLVKGSLFLLKEIVPFCLFLLHIFEHLLYERQCSKAVMESKMKELMVVKFLYVSIPSSF